MRTGRFGGGGRDGKRESIGGECENQGRSEFLHAAEM